MHLNHSRLSQRGNVSAIFRGILLLLIAVLSARLLYRSYQKGNSGTLRKELDAAIVSGDLEKINRLLEQKIDLDSKTDQGINIWDRIAFPPTNAVGMYRSEILPERKEKIPKILQTLLDHGADPNARCNNGITLLVATRDQPKVIKLLLDRGAKADARNSRGCNALFNYVDDAETTRLLINAGADVHAREGFSGQTPLMVATQSGTVQTVRLLLDRGSPLEDKDNNGATPLLLAAQFGSQESVALLMERGTDIHATDRKGKTGLNYALDNRDMAIGEMFLKKGVRYCFDPEKDTFLLLTPDKKRLDFLIRCGVNINSCHKHTGNTALLQAIIMRNQTFLEQIPRNIEATQKRRSEVTANVHRFGVNTINLDVVELLLAKGADPNIANAHGWTPLLAATASNNIILVKMLLAHGANVHQSMLAGITPLRIAQAYGDTEIEQLLRQKGA